MSKNGFQSNLKIGIRLVKFLNVVLVSIPFFLAWWFYLNEQLEEPYYYYGNLLILACFVILYCMFGRVYEAFLISYNRISEMVGSQALALILADFIMFIINWLLLKHFPNLLIYIGVFAAQMVLSVLWSVLSHNWYFLTHKPKKTFIVWDMRRGMEDLISSYDMKKKFDVVGDCKAKHCVKDVSMLEGMDVVFLSGVHSHDRNIIIKYCIANDITTFIVPRIGDTLMSGARKVHMLHLPILRLDRYHPAPEYVFVKRLVDIVLSAIALVIASPVILVTSILIKREDGGPVFYRQTRLTKDGKEFDILKFRSMRVDAEKDGVARLSSGDNDDRITRIGKKIRAVRIDELPQLINILRGDMSIVGLCEIILETEKNPILSMARGY